MLSAMRFGPSECVRAARATALGSVRRAIAKDPLGAEARKRSLDNASWWEYRRGEEEGAVQQYAPRFCESDQLLDECEANHPRQPRHSDRRTRGEATRVRSLHTHTEEFRVIQTNRMHTESATKAGTRL